MGDALAGQGVEALVESDRIGSRQRAVDAGVRRDDADGADRGRRMAEALPDLAAEGGDRGLAAGAGDRDDRGRLPGVEGRGGKG